MLRTLATIAASLVLTVAVEAGGLSTPRAYSNRILIPAAISADGANGTTFRSDIRLTNQSDRPQRVQLDWLPRDGAPGTAVVTIVELDPHETLASDDFVLEVMNRGGLGAILVNGIDETGAADPDARLHATARVWTPQPGSEGTSSQSFSPIPLKDVVSDKLFIVGHRRNEQYRTNIGIVNLDSGTHTFLVTVSGETPTLVPEEYRVTVPGFAMVQFPVTGAQQNQLRVDIEEDIVPGGPRLSLWTAYASSVDNVTGDGWTTLGTDRAAE
ncbi:MAG: hypothetical protein ACYC3G_04905 [Minisyncoccota bacterium]